MPFAPPRRRTTLLLAVVGGLVLDAGFPGLGWWPLTFLAMALLFVALGRDRAWWNTLVGLVFGLAFFLPHITWTEGAVGAVPWLALSVVEAGFVAAFGAAWTWARRGAVTWQRARLQVPVFAILWVGFEEARSVWPFGGFPWGRLAFSQADSPLGALAWLGGATLVSAAVAVVGAVVALALISLRRIDVGSASGYLVLAVVLVIGGLLVPLDSRAQEGTLAVGAVQGNVPDRGLDSFQQAREVLDNHVSGTHALLDQVEPGELDVVLWPENGSDIDPRADADAAEAISEAARAVEAPILVGTDNFPETGGRLNTALLWDPEDGAGASYAKRRPAPFAEYIPMREIARQFSDAVDRVRTDMIGGEEVGAMAVAVPRLERDVTLALGICFEVAYDVLIREAVQEGGEVLVIPTNNATFGRTDESTQQLAMSRLRAIEHGRATVQISTVGVSAVISPTGLVREETGLFTAEQMVASVPLRSELTPATRYGSHLSWALRGLAVVVTVAGMAGAVRVRRAERVAPGEG
ncbi:apolipoprotein N-acyltransferase [Actinotalea sp. BY-33]|uniref:Apolipoprotein N-acyltransferase n=1 Tax=Actinotalea soli TaxID=2819234 RepID=A0A939LMT3_9CELL|nr:apolipoprotein N-acyltransferase [Actinotalea soli]MBO1750406.1 apolipoprotein N-acyltransferase [Actinotalea soli]